MTPENVGALLQDREHNIWVGTDSSLHRFSRSNVLGNVDAVLPSRRPTILCLQPETPEPSGWCATSESVGHLYEIRAGAVVSQQITPQLTVAYRDSEGTIWFGGPTVLARLEKGRLVTTSLPAQLRGGFI